MRPSRGAELPKRRLTYAGACGRRHHLGARTPTLRNATGVVTVVRLVDSTVRAAAALPPARLLLLTAHRTSSPLSPPPFPPSSPVSP